MEALVGDCVVQILCLCDTKDARNVVKTCKSLFSFYTSSNWGKIFRDKILSRTYSEEIVTFGCVAEIRSHPVTLNHEETTRVIDRLAKNEALRSHRKFENILSDADAYRHHHTILKASVAKGVSLNKLTYSDNWAYQIAQQPSHDGKLTENLFYVLIKMRRPDIAAYGNWEIGWYSVVYYYNMLCDTSRYTRQDVEFFPWKLTGKRNPATIITRNGGKCLITVKHELTQLLECLEFGNYSSYHVTISTGSFRCIPMLVHSKRKGLKITVKCVGSYETFYDGVVQLGMPSMIKYCKELGLFPTTGSIAREIAKPSPMWHIVYEMLMAINLTADKLTRIEGIVSTLDHEDWMERAIIQSFYDRLR